jgi:hypothetical protein
VLRILNVNVLVDALNLELGPSQCRWDGWVWESQLVCGQTERKEGQEQDTCAKREERRLW